MVIKSTLQYKYLPKRQKSIEENLKELEEEIDVINGADPEDENQRKREN